MSKHGTLFGFILGAGAVAGLVALSKKTEAVEQLKAKYKAVVEEMKDYADMSGKHDGTCTGNCDKCKVSEAMDKVSNIKHAVEKKVYDVVSDKEQFDKLINLFKEGTASTSDAEDIKPQKPVDADATSNEVIEPDNDPVEAANKSDDKADKPEDKPEA